MIVRPTLALLAPGLLAIAAFVALGWEASWNPLTAPSGWWQTGNAIVGNANVGQQCTQAVPCS